MIAKVSERIHLINEDLSRVIAENKQINKYRAILRKERANNLSANPNQRNRHLAKRAGSFQIPGVR